MCKKYLLSCFLISILLIAGCGGSSGSGASSPAGSLTLVTDRIALNTGDSLVATVTLTPAVVGKPVNGLEVWVRSSDNSVIADTSGTTDTLGKANIVLTANSVISTRTITLVATMTGVTQSTSIQVTVTPKVVPKVATLTVTLPATSTASFKAGGGLGTIVLSGTNIKFVDANSNPIQGQVVMLSVDSITGRQPGDSQRVFFDPIGDIEITAPPGVLNLTTDSNGAANIPMGVDMYIPAVASTENNIVVNWRATTIYLGQTILVTGQSAFKITAN